MDNDSNGFRYRKDYRSEDKMTENLKQGIGSQSLFLEKTTPIFKSFGLVIKDTGDEKGSTKIIKDQKITSEFDFQVSGIDFNLPLEFQTCKKYAYIDNEPCLHIKYNKYKKLIANSGVLIQELPNGMFLFITSVLAKETMKYVEHTPMGGKSGMRFFPSQFKQLTLEEVCSKVADLRVKD